MAWLDVVTYLHHHGPSDKDEEVPWYRGEEWNYMRGGLSTIDRDYGIFNKIHHDIGTHVVHHLFPQVRARRRADVHAGVAPACACAFVRRLGCRLVAYRALAALICAARACTALVGPGWSGGRLVVSAGPTGKGRSLQAHVVLPPAPRLLHAWLCCGMPPRTG